MGNLKFFEAMIEKQMLDLHTAFIAKILSVSENTAKIQPLGLTKEMGGTAKSYAPISSAAITNQAKFKLFYDKGTVTANPISKGDIVVCICCDRDITEAKKGKNALPPSGHHNMSDCIIVGVL